MKYASESRREIGIRTVFNVLGPLTNPAGADAQLLGVYDSKLVAPITSVLHRLGCIEAMVVHGVAGLDEISTVGKTVIAHLKDGNISKEEMSPGDFGLKKADIADLQSLSAQESAQTILKILNGEALGTAKADIVLVNSAAGIIVGGKADNFKDAIELARKSIESKSAYCKLKDLVKASGGNLTKLEGLESQND